VDLDGLSNDMDTCPYVANTEDPFLAGAPGNGPDGDMLDSACDPTPASKSDYIPTAQEDGDNLLDLGPPAECNDNADNDSDGKKDELDPDCHDTTSILSDSDVDGFLNNQDTCPLFQNPSTDPPGGFPVGTAADKEPGLAAHTAGLTGAAEDGGPQGDSIGDDCDLLPNTADGDWFNVINVDSVCITTHAPAGGAGPDDADNDGWCSDIDPNDGVPDDIGGVGSNLHPDATDPDGDDDSSGKSYTLANSNQEWAVGADPLNNCPLIDGHDTWPPDVTSLFQAGIPDGVSDIFDISLWTPPVFGKSVGAPEYELRKDLTSLFNPGVPDGTIDIFDISLLTPPVFGKDCTQ